MTYPMNDALRHAATLMGEARWVEAVYAYRAICQQHPEHAAIAASQVGAAYFFLKQYDQAIRWYEYSGQLGFDARMTAENIAEAREAMESYRPMVGDVALMETGELYEYHADGQWRVRGS